MFYSALEFVYYFAHLSLCIIAYLFTEVGNLAGISLPRNWQQHVFAVIERAEEKNLSRSPLLNFSTGF